MQHMKNNLPPDIATVADSERFSVRIGRELLVEFGKIADQQGVSRNRLLRRLVYQTVAEAHKAQAQ
jgi:metal-responsive CopG/Arc/MetJ family transcriptional regulator